MMGSNALMLMLVLMLGSAVPVPVQDSDPIRVFISVDMEGIGGVGHPEMISASGGAAYERGRALMVAEVNAAIEGAREAGASEFVVNDSHGSMRNVRIEDLAFGEDVEVTLISHNSKPLGMMQGIGPDFDAVFFIGYHAMEGEPGFLAHTGSGGRIARISVDGRPMSEGGMNARVAGAYDVPVALATGDEDFVREIRTLLDGELETVSVKRAIRRQTAELLHPDECRRRIKEGARRAIERLGSFVPTRASATPSVEITYKNPDLADIAAILPAVERSGHYSVRFETDDYVQAYQMIRVLYRNLTE